MRIPILIDTDANNELDDQHALAYAFFSRATFDVVGVTVNNTPYGDGIEGQFREAERIMRLCNVHGEIPLYRGSEGNLADILPAIVRDDHDGFQAIDFIIESARSERSNKLVLIAIGKLTNVALAIAKAPEIASQLRLVWLGSNYPFPGEYNLWADPNAVNFVIDSEVEFEIVTVRYRETTGATAVSVGGSEIASRMKSSGPVVDPVEGRHGGHFSCFGDYSISLFEHVKFARRPLFDVVAVAVVKEPSWGRYTEILAPKLDGVKWIEGSNPHRRIGIWEHFDREAIIEDFFAYCSNPSSG